MSIFASGTSIQALYADYTRTKTIVILCIHFFVQFFHFKKEYSLNNLTVVCFDERCQRNKCHMTPFGANTLKKEKIRILFE